MTMNTDQDQTEQTSRAGVTSINRSSEAYSAEGYQMCGIRIMMLLRRVAVLLVAVAATFGSLHANPAGAGDAAAVQGLEGEDFEFEVRHAGQTIRVLGYRPAGRKDGPLLVLFHGASRDAYSYRRGGRVLANRLGMLLVVPEFDRKRFDSQSYQEGGVLRDGKLLPVTERTFSFLPPLLEEVNRREGRKMPYYLVGHSAGAQFVCRLAALFPSHARRLVAVNPSSLVFPNHLEAYPYGFGGLSATETSEDALKRYLGVPLTLYLGTDDIGANRLDTRPAAMRQGASRIERGRNTYAAAKRLAEEKHWPFRWKLIEAEGLGHGSGPMWEHPKINEAILDTGVE